MHRRRLILVIGGLLLLLVAAMAIPRLPRSSPHHDLTDPSPAVRLAAIRSLDANSDVDLLLVAVKDEDSDIRLVTAWRLGEKGRDAEKRVSALIDALHDRHAGVRQAAVESLSSLGPASGPATVSGIDLGTRPQRGPFGAFGGNHRAGCAVLFADGSVRHFAGTLSETEWARMAVVADAAADDLP